MSGIGLPFWEEWDDVKNSIQNCADLIKQTKFKLKAKMVKKISETKDLRGDRHMHLLPPVKLNGDYLSQFEPIGSNPEFKAFCRVVSSNRDASNWENGLSHADVDRVRQLLQDREDSRARCEVFKKEFDSTALGRESRIQASATNEITQKQDRATKELFERRVGQIVEGVQTDKPTIRVAGTDAQAKLIESLGCGSVSVTNPR